MDDYFEPQRDLSKMRESTNVQDVRAFPPRPNPRSRGMLGGGMPHYFDPATGRYQDSMVDLITGALRLGLELKQKKENPPLAPEEAAALIRKIQPIFEGSK